MSNLTEDTNPALSVRAVPPHRERWDTIGRLYRRPEFVLPTDYQSLPTLKQLITDGHLMPSITNVIGVRNSPHLIPWASKLVAQTAIEIAKKWPSQITARPESALKWLKDVPEREKVFWGNQGTRVHTACELLAMGKTIDHLKLTEYEQACVDRWKEWLDKFQPHFNFLELTGFGKTSSGHSFAGTADFHATINGVNILGDYKCVTDETPVLLANGTQIPAKDVTAGTQVVAWDEKQGMHIATVSSVGDNGEQDIVVIRTDSGQEIECTTNHPMLSQGFGWKKAEDIQVGDPLFIASGWSYSPYKVDTVWPYNKHLSPYLLGMLWSLASFSKVDWTDNGKFEFPKVARAELFDELASFGFLRSKDDKLRVKTGLQRVAKKTKITISNLLDIINMTEVPNIVLGSSLIFQQAFISGVQEVFANKGFSKEHFFVEFTNVSTLRSLQQLYLNLGQESKLGFNPNTRRALLRLPFQSNESLHVYGVEQVKVSSVKKLETTKHTIAIEVAGAHTHVTAGLITHNTNRSGLHADIALQLAANREVTEISPDGRTMVAPMPVDMAVGLHINPKATKMQEIASGPEQYEAFEALRTVWDFHAFDGKLTSDKGVFLREMKEVSDI